MNISNEDEITGVDETSVSAGNYAVVEGDINGQSKLILVEKGEDDSWSPVGENETFKIVLTSALENLRVEDGQSYFPSSFLNGNLVPNIINLQGDINSVSGYKLSVPSGSYVESILILS